MERLTRADLGALARDLPPVAELARRLQLHAGIVRWLPRPQSDFASEGAWRSFNSRYAGSKALTARAARASSCCHGQITLNGVRYWLLRSHVVWALTTGIWPTKHIGHRNGNTSDDRYENLREQTESQQSAVSRCRSTTRSGARGVVRRRGKFEARIKAHGELLFVGRFDELAAAVAARNAAALEHFGEFARLSQMPAPAPPGEHRP